MTFLYIKKLYPSISSSSSSSSSSSIGIHLRTTLHHMSLTIVHYFIILKALKIMKVFDVNGDGAMQFEEFRGIHILLLLLLLLLLVLPIIMMEIVMIIIVMMVMLEMIVIMMIMMSHYLRLYMLYL